jgi:hypothetical protein
MNDTKDAATLVQEAIAQAQKARVVGQAELTIWGGRFPADRLTGFLNAWGGGLAEELPWRMYEYVNRFVVLRASPQDAALPGDMFALERARLFGANGDMDLRRDGDEFRWRLIGSTQVPWPHPSDFQYKDFWAQDQAIKFREIPQTYYQWRPNEGRVNPDWFQAGARGEHVYLAQLCYLLNGQIAFVRYTGFEMGEVKHG